MDTGSSKRKEKTRREEQQTKIKGDREEERISNWTIIDVNLFTSDPLILLFGSAV